MSAILTLIYFGLFTAVCYGYEPHTAVILVVLAYGAITHAESAINKNGGSDYYDRG